MNKTLKIKKLSAKGFRSFAEESVYDNFIDSGLMAIFGKNLDTNGSNASGKSNFHLAISYALGYCPHPATELQSWLTEEPMQVALTLEDGEGREIVVMRGAETSISVGGEKYKGAKVVEKKLSELIPLSKDLLEVVTFRKQRSFGHFLSMTDSQKKDFLSTLLELGQIELQIAMSHDQISDLSKRFEEKRLEHKAASMLLTEPVKPELEDDAHINEQLAGAEAELSVLEKEHVKFNDRLLVREREIEEITQQYSLSNFKFFWEKDAAVASIELENKELDQALLKELENSKHLNDRTASINLDIQKLMNKTALESSYLNELNNVKNTLDAIDKENKCNTCNQPWDPPEGRVAQLKSRLLDLKVSIEEIKALKKEIEALKVERQEMQRLLGETQIGTISTKIQENRKLLDTFSKEREVAKAFAIKKYNAELKEKIEAIKECYKKVETDAKENQQQCTALLKIMEACRSSANAISRINQYKISDYENLLLKYNFSKSVLDANAKALEILEKELKKEEDYHAMLKAFLGNIVEEVLNEISSEANDMLSMVSNTSLIAIQFDTEKVTQKGSVRQEIRPVITKAGVEISSKSGLSGGQYNALELILDLAIDRVISRRTGFMPGWLILDEPFDGQDVLSKQGSLQILRKFADDKLVMIIDHSTEIKEYFDAYVEIECKDEKSIIR